MKAVFVNDSDLIIVSLVINMHLRHLVLPITIHLSRSSEEDKSATEKIALAWVWFSVASNQRI